jgi:4-hydroxybenzoate polyprenyltransferase
MTLQDKIIEKFNHFSELVMFKHSIFSLPFIFIAMVVASHGWFGWKLFFLGIIEAVSARNFAMGVNRYLDRDIDKINPRTKNRPSVDGRVDTKEMQIFIVANALIFILVSYFINSLALALSIPILFVLGIYTYFKRFSAVAHWILGISLGLAPIAGAVAVLGTIPLWSIYLGIGVMFWVAGFDLLYSLQDIEFDKANNLHSIPAKLGSKNTMTIARISHTLAIIFWGLFVAPSGVGSFGTLAVIVSTMLLIYEHYLVSDDFTKIDKAFFTINGYLGFVFLLIIISGMI